MRLALSLLSLLALLPTEADAKRPKPEPCPGGRFVVQGDPILPGGATPDALVVGDTVAIGGCAPAPVRRKATKKGTRLSAKWKTCTGVKGRTTLAATIDPTCETVSGRIRAKKAKLKRSFTARRGRCGDDVVDAGAGEACEGAGACTGGTCNATTCACAPDEAGNGAPTAAFSAAATVAAGSPLAFDATASTDPDGDPLVFSWAFGDGGRGGAARIAHVFAIAGTFDVVLTVADGRGGTATAQQTITVGPGPTANGTITVDGVVRTTGGLPLGGVVVALQGGGASGTTASDGTVSLTIPRGIPAVLALSRDGYVDQTVVVQTPSVAESAIFQAEMLAREAAQSLDADAGGSLAGKDGTAITLPAGALALPNGTPATGAVDVHLTPVDPTTTPDAFPGVFGGVEPSGQQGLLLSYGTVEFGLVQNGQRLDLAPGTKATIEIPFYGNTDKAGTPIVVGDTVPLWSLDEQTGTWVQEGVGTVVASATSPTGFALRGEVAHFSWWNSDLFDSPPYEPKPKCCVDTNYDGECEDLSNTGYCWHYGTGPEQDGPGTFGALAAAPRLPNFAAETMLPVGGGTVLPVPANYPITLRSSALAGTYVGTTTLEGGPGVEEEITVVLYPAGGETTPISIPWDEVYTIAPTETDRYVFNATAGDPVYVRVSRSSGGVSGNVFVDGPATNDYGPSAFGSSPREFGFLAPATGAYFVNVEGTSETGAYRLEVQETGSFPLVLSTTPADGATGRPLSTTVSVTFTTAIAAASVTAQSFRVTQAGVAVAGTRQVNGDTITFTPSAPLAGGAPHTVTLGTGIAAEGGTGLPQDVTFAFTTVDTVGSLTPLAPGARPAIAALPNGEAMVVFENDQAGAPRGTAASHYVPGEGWSPPELLRASNDPRDQQVAANAAGAVVAIYRQQATAFPQPYDLWASHWTAAGGWSAPVSIESSSESFGAAGNLSGDLRGLAVAIDAAGNALAVFTRQNQAIWWNRYTAGVGWGTGALLEDVATGSIEGVYLAMNAAGEALLAWSQALSGTNQVLVRRFTPAGGWDAAVPVASVYSPSGVGIDDAGNGLVLWRDSGSWRTRRWDAEDETWSLTTQPVQADQSGLSLGVDDDVDLRMRPDGTAVAGGHAFVGSAHSVWAAEFTPDPLGGEGTWGTPVTLEAVQSGGTSISTTPDGTTLAIWTGPNASDALRWKAYRPGVGWDATIGVVTPVEEFNRPHGAVAADGSLFAVTQRFDELSLVLGVRLD